MQEPEDATPRERELYAIIARLEARLGELEAENARLGGTSRVSGGVAWLCGATCEEAGSIQDRRMQESSFI